MPDYLHSLIPITDFKALLSLDDREDACYPMGSLSRFCLTTATYIIEQYCHRRLLKKRQSEYLVFAGDYEFPLGDYPVREILAVYLSHPAKESELLEPDFYHTIIAIISRFWTIESIVKIPCF